MGMGMHLAPCHYSRALWGDEESSAGVAELGLLWGLLTKDLPAPSPLLEVGVRRDAPLPLLCRDGGTAAAVLSPHGAQAAPTPRAFLRSLLRWIKGKL